jgi:rhamnosyltransferase
LSSREQFSTAAIIAAYKPGTDLLLNIQAAMGQVAHVVVVDDGSGAEYAPIFKTLEDAGATVVTNSQNVGIASSLNAGVHAAATRWHPDFYVTLDQDSALSGGYVSSAIETYRAAIASGLPVGFVSAASYSGAPVPTLRKNRNTQFKLPFDPMQSGFVIPVSTFDRIGPFADEFFIDGVDSEFTARARANGLEIVVGRSCSIEHRLGERTAVEVFGRPLRLGRRVVSFNYHSPARVYYICRNGTALTLRYFLGQPSWTMRRLGEELKGHMLRLLFSPNRPTIIRAALAGFRDALMGRSGPVPESLGRRLQQ